jgi:amino acid permease
MILILIVILLFVVLYHFVEIKKQNETMIKQNNQVISLLHEIKEK